MKLKKKEKINKNFYLLMKIFLNKINHLKKKRNNIFNYFDFKKNSLIIVFYNHTFYLL